ncbi:MAG TPA: nicotinate-nucleotide adenylyltransferase [Pyrinomonadaceae bacterium]|nr:nicotinate-nucleotide adenylyltransferase [Pyrinomonadaceae bacterium]
MKRLKRIALYGGTFDPVHVGHVTVAGNLLKLFELDQILFIPAHVAPHKRGSAVTPALHRYAMLALATQQHEQFIVSAAEINQPQRPYTVDTLSQFQAASGDTARLFFVMGADSWEEITTWREWERVVSMTDQIVVTRPGYEISAAHVTTEVRRRIVDLRGANSLAVARTLDAGGGTGNIFFTDAARVDVSATAVRRAARGEGIHGDLTTMVASSVANYIRKYKLYEGLYES